MRKSERLRANTTDNSTPSNKQLQSATLPKAVDEKFKRKATSSIATTAENKKPTKKQKIKKSMESKTKSEKSTSSSSDMTATIPANPTPAPTVITPSITHSADEESENYDSEGAGMDLAHLQSMLGLQYQSRTKSTHKFTQILEHLKKHTSPMLTVALQELAEILSVSTEETFMAQGGPRAMGFDTSLFIKSLITIVKGVVIQSEEDEYNEFEGYTQPINPEAILLACRCLANLIEALPSTTAYILENKGVEALIGKLMEIEYIELAEQILCVLEKISLDYPKSVLKANGLIACLQYIDFFGLHVQRSAVYIVANTCQALLYQVSRPNSGTNIDLDDQLAKVNEILPILERLLGYSDHKIVDQSSKCVLKIIEWGTKSTPQTIEKCIQESLLLALLNVIENVSTTPPVFSQVISTLTLIIKHSPKFTVLLLGPTLNIAPKLYKAMTLTEYDGQNQGLSANSLGSLINRPHTQLLEILILISEVLPKIPSRDNSTTAPITTSDQIIARLEERQESLKQNMPLFITFSEHFMQLFIGLFNASVNSQIRLTVVEFVCKSVHYIDYKDTSCLSNLSQLISEILALRDSIFVDATQETVKDYFKDARRAGFLGAIHGCIYLIDVIFERNYGELITQFTREGILLDLLKTVKSLEKFIQLNGEVIHSEAAPLSTHTAIESTQEVQMQNAITRAQTLLQTLGDNPSAIGVGEMSGLAFNLRRIVENISAARTVQPSSVTIKSIFGDSDPDEAITWIFAHATILLSKLDNSSKQSCISEELAQIPSLLRGDNELDQMKALASLASLFSSESSLTGFEIIQNEIIPSLIDYFTSSKNSKKMLCRLKAFIDAFVKAPTQPIIILLKKLQELLSRNEHYETLTASHSRKPSLFGFFSTNQSTEQNPMMQLTQQIRVRLVPKDVESVSPGNRTGVVVSVPAIVSVKQLEEFLRVRIVWSNENVVDVVQIVDENAVIVEDDDNEDDNDYGDEDLGEFMDEYMDEEEYDEEGETNVSDMLLLAEEERKRERNNANDITSASITSMVSDLRTPDGKSWAEVAKGEFKLKFDIGNREISRDETIFGAVFRNEQNSKGIQNPNIWNEVHTIEYSKGASLSSRNSGVFKKLYAPQVVSLLDYLIEFNTVSDSRDIQILDLLQILNYMHTCSQQLFTDPDILSSMSRIPQEFFINNKLTAKVNRQLDEPLIVASRILPEWCEVIVNRYSFVLPIETRLTYLQSTAFGYTRSISRWQTQQQTQSNQNQDTISLGRVTRQKIRISRQNIVLNMLKMMARYGSSQAYLEVEFNDECGTGLGPTLEFYSMVCERLQRTSGVKLQKKASPLIMWRGTDIASKTQSHLNSVTGLFPVCLKVNKNKDSVIDLFTGLGTLLAKALLDSRTLDMRLNPIFIHLVMETIKIEKLDIQRQINLLKAIDPQFFTSMDLLYKYSINTGHATDIENLCLDFTYPGFPKLDLQPRGKKIEVSESNLKEYIAKVLDFTLGSGISEQVNAFRNGFNIVFPISDLAIFKDEEKVALMGGSTTENWDYHVILQAIKADHGFTFSSQTVLNLVQFMSSLEEKDKRSFLMFITGSPRLPYGGFQALHPPLTIVCKSVGQSENADDYLPSVMTCVNYLKVPNYSSYAVLAERFQKVMLEGQGSFHLS